MVSFRHTCRMYGATAEWPHQLGLVVLLLPDLQAEGLLAVLLGKNSPSETLMEEGCHEDEVVLVLHLETSSLFKGGKELAAH